MRPKVVIVLSSKSAGSSVLHRTLATAADARAVTASAHEENETLYWVKAAAALALPQDPMVRSIVPMTAAAARSSLTAFLAEHGIEVPAGFPATVDDLVRAWIALRQAHAPVMIEKSPHHLASASALRLLARLPAADPDADYLFVGLVREPMEVCYSAWRRFRFPPERYEQEWLLSYANLLWCRDLFGDRLVTLRYEDLVADPAVLAPVGAFLGAGADAFDTAELHAGSVGRWRTEPGFGFRLSPATRALARVYGYDDDHGTPHASVLWPLRRSWLDARHQWRRWRAGQPLRVGR